MTKKKESLKQSIGFSAIGHLGSQAISLISFIVLARLLSPHEFGLMAMVAIFTSFASIFIDMGMGDALIHNQNASEEHYSTALWFNLYIAVFFAVVIALLSGIASGFFKDTELQLVLIVTAFLLPINALSIVPLAMLQKQQSFKTIAIVDLGSALCNVIVAVSLAYYGFGVWALVAGLLASSIAKRIILLFVLKWLPKLLFCKKAFCELWGYSSYLLGTGVTNYLITNLDNALVGRFIGSTTLGAYNYAYQLANLPARIVNQIFSRVFFTQYSTFKDDHLKIKRMHFKIVRMLASITFPTLFTLSAISDVFVVSVLGDQWIQMGHILSLMCIIFMLDSIGGLNNPLFLSQGKTKSLFRLTLFIRSSLILAMVIGIQFGLDGLLWGLLIAKGINFYPVYKIVGKTIGFSVNEFIKNILPTFIISAAVSIVLVIIKNYLMGGLNLFLILVLLCMTSIALYLMLMILFQKSVIDDLRASLFRRTVA